ncbi:MAG: HAMP domain-containing sensor histidine kinase [Bacteroidia bacterium]|nr:HAMP domain-containing sensor histidine kinase [Bacteroidia bacterium]
MPNLVTRLFEIRPSAESPRRQRVVVRVVAVMAVALSGIVALQVWWVLREHAQQRARFDLGVQAALQHVVNQLELAESRAAVQELLAQEKSIDGSLRWASVSPPTGASTTRTCPVPIDQPYTAVELSGGRQHRLATSDPVVVDQWSTGGHSVAIGDHSCQRTYSLAGQRGQYRLTFTQGTDSEAATGGLADGLENQRYLLKLRFKLENLQIALTELLDNPKPVAARLDSATLAAALATAFANHGITQPFSWWVDDRAGLGRQVALGTERRADDAFRAELFPNDLQPQRAQLHVVFPNRFAYSLRTSGGALVASVVLLALVVGGYAHTLSTLVRQKKLSQMKTDFINNMTHEFKTPLATLSLAAQALAEPKAQASPERMERLTGIVRHESKRLEGQVERILQLAEMEDRGLRMDSTVVNLCDLLADAVQHTRLTAESKGGLVRLYDAVPLGTTLLGDPHHLSGVLYNLLDNAIKYSEAPPEITVRSYLQGDTWHCSIADRGIGMSAEQVRHIFEAFYRASTGNRHDVKGFGLGLAYVKYVLQAHEGTIAVHSTPGQGSEFSFTIPLHVTHLSTT